MRAWCVAIVLGAGCGSSGGDSGQKVKIAKLAVKQLAMEDFPKWAMANVSKACPDALLDVLKHAGKTDDDLKDPWGTNYKMLCGAGLPPGVKGGFAVYSLGEDKADGTADDVRSWEK
jgi:hypothetical protein